VLSKFIKFNLVLNSLISIFPSKFALSIDTTSDVTGFILVSPLESVIL